MNNMIQKTRAYIIFITFPLEHCIVIVEVGRTGDNVDIIIALPSRKQHNDAMNRECHKMDLKFN